MTAVALAALGACCGAFAQNPLARGATAFPLPHTGNGIARLGLDDIAVSAASPFANDCGIAFGTLYRGAEVEPSLAVNPRDSRHWIAAWQQDRWSNGSSRGIVAAVTFDAGSTWTRVAPRYTVCSGGTYERASDPWIDFAPDGTAWLSALVTTGTSFTAKSINAIVVSRSSDGGMTWSEPYEIIRDSGATFFNDKETITADPFDARFVYAAWDRLQGSTRGPAYFSRTTDGGATWETPRPIYDPGSGQQTIGNLIRVLPDGTLVDLLTHIAAGADDEDKAAPEDATLEVLRSTDRGLTWSEPIRVAAYRPAGVLDPFTRAPVRDGTPIAALAVSPEGALYVAWQDARMSPDPERDDILLSRSADGGFTWSQPVRVNGAPGKSAFAPQVNVAADGTIGVTYFDLRSDTVDAGSLLADYWIARSHDGLTWIESHVAGPFDLLAAPFAGGYFLGDYMGLASVAGDFLALHARTTGKPGDPTDIYLARIPGTTPGTAYRADTAKAAPGADAIMRRWAMPRT